MQDIYFGTYTKRDSKGIYKASFDERTGQLSDLQLVAQEPNPTYLAFQKLVSYTVWEPKRVLVALRALTLTTS